MEQEFGEERYVVRVGGREHVIYDLAGADAAAAEEEASIWFLTPELAELVPTEADEASGT